MLWLTLASTRLLSTFAKVVSICTVGRTFIDDLELCSLRVVQRYRKIFRAAIDDKYDGEGRALIWAALCAPIAVVGRRRTLGKGLNGHIHTLVCDVQLRDTLGVGVVVGPVAT